MLEAAVNETTDSSIRVSWSKPDGPLTGFCVHCKQTQSDYIESRILHHDKTNIRVSGLLEGTDYIIEIVAVNKSVESDVVALSATTLSASLSIPDDSESWKTTLHCLL